MPLGVKSVLFPACRAASEELRGEWGAGGHCGSPAFGRTGGGCCSCSTFPSAQLLLCTVVSSGSGAGTALLSQSTAGSRIAHLSQVILSWEERQESVSWLLSSWVFVCSVAVTVGNIHWLSVDFWGV